MYYLIILPATLKISKIYETVFVDNSAKLSALY
jgi:hypothetical protein